MKNVTYRRIGVAMVLGSIAIFLGMANLAFAESNAGAISGSASESTSSSGSIGLGQGGSGYGGSSHSSSANQNIVGSGNTYEAADFGEQVPTMFIPNLTTSNGTCANSFSMGGSGAGFGVAFGKTYVSGPCNARFNANQLNALGHKRLAMETMCGIKSVYEADQRTANQYGTPALCAKRGAEADEVQPVTNANPSEVPVVLFDDKEMNEVNELAMLDSADGMTDFELGKIYAKMYQPKWEPENR